MRNPTKTLAMYHDIQRVLDAAIASAGGIFRCETHGRAVHWRQRAYKFRKLYRDLVNQQNSPYDTLTFREIGPKENFVTIAVIETPGEFIPNNPADAPAPVDDELLAEALRIAGDII